MLAEASGSRTHPCRRTANIGFEVRAQHRPSLASTDRLFYQSANLDITCTRQPPARTISIHSSVQPSKHTHTLSKKVIPLPITVCNMQCFSSVPLADTSKVANGDTPQTNSIEQCSAKYVKILKKLLQGIVKNLAFGR